MLRSDLSVTLVTEAWEAVSADADIAFHIFPMLWSLCVKFRGVGSWSPIQ